MKMRCNQDAFILSAIVLPNTPDKHRNPKNHTEFELYDPRQTNAATAMPDEQKVQQFRSGNGLYKGHVKENCQYGSQQSDVPPAEESSVHRQPKRQHVAGRRVCHRSVRPHQTHI